jgi:anaerobic magnesium-protoporphyrin IX monomethyl ester cyclase
MNVTLISPRLAVQKEDFLGSGVPYWPIELATFASVLREAHETVNVLDLFGSAPHRLTDAGDHFLQGTPIEEEMATPAVAEAQAFVVYAISYMSHGEILQIVRRLKDDRPDTPVLVLENSQAVTAYSLPRMAAPFFEAGVDGLVCGEPHFNWPEIKSYLQNPNASAPSNVITRVADKPPARIVIKGQHYPVPAWDLFPLEGYWTLPYAHGPKTPRFLPLLTSRGCPFPCDFCVVPETNDRRWRGNEPVDVVSEILELRDRFGIRDFQIEDLNPTTNHERFEEICRLLVERKAGIRFALVSGTKAETVHLEKVPLYAAAGCRYISISPESGSVRLMKVIGKPFDYDHGLALVAACRANGIRTQACFLVGHPGETESDYQASRLYMRDMVVAGLDEVAVFIVSPFAGSRLYADSKIAVADAGALPSFSPMGRKGADVLVRRRRDLIRLFFIEKLKRGPDLWMQGIRSIFGTPQTKMENLPRRVAFVRWRALKARRVE